MKCPVCKFECYNEPACPTCGFNELTTVFISKEDALEWTNAVVWPYRLKYWESISDFEIADKTVVKYLGRNSNVIVPYGIEIIGECAFLNQKSISNVFLPETVFEIQDHAFFNSHVEMVEIPSKLKSIGDLAFSSSRIIAVTIPGSCSIIGSMAFDECENLQTAFIQKGVEQIEEYAFARCDKLSIITIPETVSKIGAGALSTGNEGTHIVLNPQNRNYYIDGLFLIEKSTGTIITGSLANGFPESDFVGKIGEYAFLGTSPQEDVLYIPSSIREIGESAINSCDISKIVIPDSVKTIEHDAFDTIDACQIYCEHLQRPQSWSETWCTERLQVFWGKQWKFVSGEPGLILIETEAYSAILLSAKFIEDQRHIKLEVQISNKSAKAVEFVLNDVVVDGICCEYTGCCKVGSYTDKNYVFILGTEYMKDRFCVEQLSFVSRFRSSERMTLAESKGPTYINGLYTAWEPLPF